MIATLKLKASVVFTVLFLVPMVSSAQNKPAEKPPVKAEKSDKTLAPLTLKDLLIEFPDVDGWEKSEIQKYPTPELGYSVNYESDEGGRVTIYVYNNRKKNIPDDINDKVVKSELDYAIGDIRKAGEAGYYQNIKEVKKDTVTLGGTAGKIKALHALFSFRAREQDLTSEIYLFSYRSDFIKIRATRSKEEEETENEAVSKLFAEIDALFSK